MSKFILRIIFWTIFFGAFFYFFSPTFRYIADGPPEIFRQRPLLNKFWLVLHIVSGLVVYLTGICQFIPQIRNKKLRLHRNLGKTYIIASLICITALYFVVSKTFCTSCQISQFIVNSLWLIFIVLAYYFIRNGRIILHQRFMVSSFVCAAYFVTVRLIDAFAMGFFRSITSNEFEAFLISDFAAWVVPLSLIWLFWFATSFRQKGRMALQTE